MKRLAAALAVLTPGLAGAESSEWEFEKGASWTYEATTVLEWRCFDSDRSTQGARVLRSERQEETVTLRLAVQELLAGGNARIKGVVAAVRVENASASKAEWDSSREKTSRYLGLKAYEALYGREFAAVVSPDGQVLETQNALSPQPAATPASAGEHEETAAFAMHPPTNPRTWLVLIFGTVPPSAKGERRQLRFIEEDAVAFTFRRNEKVSGRACAKLEFDTPDRESDLDPKDISLDPRCDPGAVAWSLIRKGAKKGEVWFARAGFLQKLEAESDDEVAYNDTTVSARMTWAIECKEAKGPPK
jgi:hypothetical protein